LVQSQHNGVTAYGRFLARLDELGYRYRDHSSFAQAQCPAHQDREPSLTVYAKPGRIRLRCWAGCYDRDILAVLGLGIPALYDEPLSQRRNAPYVYDALAVPALPEITATDDGNALRLVAEHGHEFRRVADMKRWLTWDGTRWALDHEDRAVREAAKELARQLPDNDRKDQSFKKNAMSTIGITSTVRMAETDPRVSILAREVDAYPELLNTPSGIVDLCTGAVKPHDPGLLLSRITAHGVDVDTPHQRWSSFLKDTFNDAEMISYIQRLSGLALLGVVCEHVLPFSYGTGANGKTVFINVLQGILGEADTGGYAVAAPDGFLMQGRDSKHETEIARMRGARLVVCAEQTSGKKFDEAKVKRLTGGDILTGRFMRGDFFDFTPSHLVWVLSNHLPEVREGGPAFWRRVQLIPFEHAVPEEQRVPDLHKQLLEEEGPAILGWAVRGAVEVLADGLKAPQRVQNATREYEISEDTLASFIRDECILRRGLWCKTGDLRARYEKHSQEMGAEPLNMKSLTMRLTSEYPVVSKKHTRLKFRVYVGIALQADDGPAGDG
jgi:putative DNA primase/helicase